MHSRKIERTKSSLKLSDEQREVLVGLLLGDAHLETQNDETGDKFNLETEILIILGEDYLQNL